MLVSLIAGVVLVIAFIVQERRTEKPMLPMSFFANRGFAVTNVVSLAMYFGMFGSIFFLSQFLQNVLGNTPLQAGVKLLVWTGATMIVSPLAGFFSERLRQPAVHGRGAGRCRRWRLAGSRSRRASRRRYASLIGPFILGGAGMALVFAPAANAVLSSVRTDQAGQASGATNAIRELGGVLGVVGAGHRVHQPWRLHLAAGVRQRAHPRRLGRRRSAGRRRAGRAGAAVQHPDRGSRHAEAEAVEQPRRRPGRTRRAGGCLTSHRIERGSSNGHQPPLATPASACPGLRAPGRADRGGGPRVRSGRPARTPVDRIARRVGVAQPYVFSLFGTKRELFLAAVERCFERWQRVSSGGRRFDPATAPPTPTDDAMGDAYVELLETERDYLMLQLQSYAACDDEVIRERVRALYARLVSQVEEIPVPAPSGSTTSSATGCRSTSRRRWGSRTSRSAASGCGRSSSSPARQRVSASSCFGPPRATRGSEPLTSASRSGWRGKPSSGIVSQGAA